MRPAYWAVPAAGQRSNAVEDGDAAHIPAGIVHATFNVSKSDATILAILSPGASKGPFMVDVSGEAPWKDLRAGA